MKRIMCAVFMVALLLCAFSSCRESVNMEALTKYQQSDFIALASVSFGEKKYTMDIEKTGEEFIFCIDDIYFVMSENGCFLQTGDFRVPLEQGAKLFEFSRMRKLFDIQSQGIWKIEKASPGGVSVYVCKNEETNTLLYIDSGTYLPLKIVCGDVEADILCFEAKS